MTAEVGSTTSLSDERTEELLRLFWIGDRIAEVQVVVDELGARIDALLDRYGPAGIDEVAA